MAPNITKSEATVVDNITEESKKVDYKDFPPPKEETSITSHLSGLLLSGSVRNTAVEWSFILAMLLMPESMNVEGSMPAFHLGRFMLAASIVTRVYNAYLEAVYFALPQYRTQPPKEHKLMERKDLTGRDAKQQHTLEWHDLMTTITSTGLSVLLYFLIPGFYPSPTSAPDSLPEKALKLIMNHYIMSFGMYWVHRAYHVVPFLWNHIHSIHHYAKTPLSRVTYQDHWFDNFGNAIVGQTFAQILVPLDYPTFIFSRIFRVLESLEKHSGHSSHYNVAHALQYYWMPYAQMPHHHDWHHEGHKSCNFTFSSLGGLWDCVFGTRKAGRAGKDGNPAVEWATRDDRAGDKPYKFDMDSPEKVLAPVALVAFVTYLKLQSNGWVVV